MLCAMTRSNGKQFPHIIDPGMLTKLSTTLNAGCPDLSLRAVPNGHPHAECRVSPDLAK